jgi:hypothetical protein
MAHFPPSPLHRTAKESGRQEDEVFSPFQEGEKVKKGAKGSCFGPGNWLFPSSLPHIPHPTGGQQGSECKFQCRLARDPDPALAKLKRLELSLLDHLVDKTVGVIEDASDMSRREKPRKRDWFRPACRFCHFLESSPHPLGTNGSPGRRSLVGCCWGPTVPQEVNPVTRPLGILNHQISDFAVKQIGFLSYTDPLFDSLPTGSFG